jgi:uncharacterized integral membrane protein
MPLGSIADCPKPFELPKLGFPSLAEQFEGGEMAGKRRPQNRTWMVLTAGLLLVLSLLAYLNVQLSVSNGFRYAGGLRIAFLLICLAFLAGAVSGLTQLSKR